MKFFDEFTIRSTERSRCPTDVEWAERVELKGNGESEKELRPNRSPLEQVLVSTGGRLGLVFAGKRRRRRQQRQCGIDATAAHRSRSVPLAPPPLGEGRARRGGARVAAAGPGPPRRLGGASPGVAGHARTLMRAAAGRQKNTLSVEGGVAAWHTRRSERALGNNWRRAGTNDAEGMSARATPSPPTWLARLLSVCIFRLFFTLRSSVKWPLFFRHQAPPPIC